MSLAYKNQNRWVANCDTPSCAGAERLWPGGATRQTRAGVKYGITRAGVMHCANCGQTSEVVFPEDRARIDQILRRRPVPETRNWVGETVEQLVEENAAHGLDST